MFQSQQHISHAIDLMEMSASKKKPADKLSIIVYLIDTMFVT